MTEQLKTLKDMPDSHCDGCEDGGKYDDPILKHELRAEAIKWYKEHGETITEPEIVVSYQGGYHYTHGMRCGARLFIQQFFDLSEEDLK